MNCLLFSQMNCGTLPVGIQNVAHYEGENRRPAGHVGADGAQLLMRWDRCTGM
jgi:hypothetical protein